MACIRCGDGRAAHYVRLDTRGAVCVGCLIEEIRELRERVADLEMARDSHNAIRAGRDATN